MMMVIIDEKLVYISPSDIAWSQKLLAADGHWTTAVKRPATENRKGLVATSPNQPGIVENTYFPQEAPHNEEAGDPIRPSVRP
jgi:hypothetical protein